MWTHFPPVLFPPRCHSTHPNARLAPGSTFRMPLIPRMPNNAAHRRVDMANNSNTYNTEWAYCGMSGLARAKYEWRAARPGRVCLFARANMYAHADMQHAEALLFQISPRHFHDILKTGRHVLIMIGHPPGWHSGIHECWNVQENRESDFRQS